MTLIPTTVFSGFLGSGKTTIISHLVDELQTQGKQAVYIKNEIGSENVDGVLMEGKHIQTKELLNGCICCTLVGPFISAIDEIVTRFTPDRIIIEASGAADPAAIALMIDSSPKLARDGVIAVIDVVNFSGYKDISQTARNQALFTDLIVFNKIELADLAQKQAVVGYVRELNTHAPIVEAPLGKISSNLIFGADPQELNHLLKTFRHEQSGAESSTHTHHAHADHLTTDGINSVAIPIPRPTTTEAITNYLQTLPKNVFRVKGILELTDGSQVLVNKVGSRTQVTPLSKEHANTTTDQLLVLIGFYLEDQQQLQYNDH